MNDTHESNEQKEYHHEEDNHMNEENPVADADHKLQLERQQQEQSDEVDVTKREALAIAASIVEDIIATAIQGMFQGFSFMYTLFTSIV